MGTFDSNTFSGKGGNKGGSSASSRLEARKKRIQEKAAEVEEARISAAMVAQQRPAEEKARDMRRAAIDTIVSKNDRKKKIDEAIKKGAELKDIAKNTGISSSELQLYVDEYH